MEKRKLVFSEAVKQREKKRVRKFTITTIVIGLILCVLVIPLLELKSYENEKNESQKYISVAKHIWYNGIKGIEYQELSIKVLDTDIEYESIYTEGICSVSDKVQIKTNRIAYWLLEMFFIILYIFLAYIFITVYKSAGYRRMVIDMNKK